MHSKQSVTSHFSEPPLTILIADDSDVLRAAVRRLLENMGHSTVVAANGHEAMDVALRGSFDVLILDVQMPELGGADVARRLRKIDPGRELWMIGISGDPSSEQDCLDAGMDAFLAKPLLVHDVIRLLAERNAATRGSVLATKAASVLPLSV